jgi:hypothetical protein
MLPNSFCPVQLVHSERTTVSTAQLAKTQPLLPSKTLQYRRLEYTVWSLVRHLWGRWKMLRRVKALFLPMPCERRVPVLRAVDLGTWNRAAASLAVVGRGLEVGLEAVSGSCSSRVLWLRPMLRDTARESRLLAGGVRNDGRDLLRSFAAIVNGAVAVIFLLTLVGSANCQRLCYCPIDEHPLGVLMVQNPSLWRASNGNVSLVRPLGAEGMLHTRNWLPHVLAQGDQYSWAPIVD